MLRGQAVCGHCMCQQRSPPCLSHRLSTPFWPARHHCSSSIMPAKKAAAPKKAAAKPKAVKKAKAAPKKAKKAAPKKAKKAAKPKAAKAAKAAAPVQA